VSFLAHIQLSNIRQCMESVITKLNPLHLRGKKQKLVCKLLITRSNRVHLLKTIAKICRGFFSTCRKHSATQISKQRSSSLDIVFFLYQGFRYHGLLTRKILHILSLCHDCHQSY